MFLGFLEVLRPNMRFIFHIDLLLSFFFTVLDANKGISLNLPSGDLSDEVYDVPLPDAIHYKYSIDMPKERVILL